MLRSMSCVTTTTLRVNYEFIINVLHGYELNP